LRIELMEDAHGTFFESGSAEPTPLLQSILKVLSPQLGALPNQISMEGHTDAQPYAKKGPYTNWELSTDRANTARRLMELNGVGANQVSQVRGFADQQLRDAAHPLDAANRRISLIVQYQDASKPLLLPALTGVAGPGTGGISGESAKNPTVKVGVPKAETPKDGTAKKGIVPGSDPKAGTKDAKAGEKKD
jgi:chemotaxis protein MotB